MDSVIMSNHYYLHVPIEIQEKIMKRLPVKSLIQFRSVSKAWKSLIDNSHFVASYTRHNQHILVKYVRDGNNNKPRYVSIVDDDTFPHRGVFLYPFHFVVDNSKTIVGCSHGLLCFYEVGTPAFIWNPSIRRGFHVDVPIIIPGGYLCDVVLGFGVCRETNELKIVKITCTDSLGCDLEGYATEVEVLTILTTTRARSWRSLRTNLNLPRKSLFFTREDHISRSVTIDGVAYWLATDWSTTGYLIISFDITTEEFGEVYLPYSLARTEHFLTFSKIRESLVVIENVMSNKMVYNLWMMEDGVPKSFTKMSTFDVNTHYDALVVGFTHRGDPIIRLTDGQLVVYEPHSRHMNNLGFDGAGHVVFGQPYTETLFLHDQPCLTDDTEVVQEKFASLQIGYAL